MPLRCYAVKCPKKTFLDMADLSQAGVGGHKEASLLEVLLLLAVELGSVTQIVVTSQLAGVAISSLHDVNNNEAVAI